MGFFILLKERKEEGVMSGGVVVMIEGEEV